jgi:hypothetical protein
MSENQKNDTGATIALVQQGAKALAYLTVAFTFLMIGIYVPTIAGVAQEQVKLAQLQNRQLTKLVADTENISAAINDAALIYSARMSAQEKAIPVRNADQIVDAATDRLAQRFGKDWEVIIRGMAAKMDTLTRR